MSIESLVAIKLNGTYNLVSNVSHILAPICAYQDNTSDVRAIDCEIDRQNGGPDYLRIQPAEDSKLAKANGLEIRFNQTKDSWIVTHGDNGALAISTLTEAMIKANKVKPLLINWFIMTSPDNLNRNSSSGPLPVKIVPQNIRTNKCVTLNNDTTDTLTRRLVSPPAGADIMNMDLTDCDENNSYQYWWLNEYIQLQVDNSTNM